MPELPEVEVTKKALESALKKTSITGVNIRNKKLRWPVEEKKIRNIIHSNIKYAWKTTAIFWGKSSLVKGHILDGILIKNREESKKMTYIGLH